MGLIKAARGAAGGVMADQWKEFFYCDAIPENVLAVKGQKKTSKRSSNTKGDDNVISNGSVIAVADGQCMLIVDQGKIVDMCAVAGEYTYDMSSEPSIFTGDLGDGIKNVFNNMVNRFTFGGEAPKDQRIYYVNTKELIGNKYVTPSPTSFQTRTSSIFQNRRGTSCARASTSTWASAASASTATTSATPCCSTPTCAATSARRTPVTVWIAS